MIMLFFIIFFLLAFFCAGLFFYLRMKNKLPDLDLKRIGYYVAGTIIIFILLSFLTAIPDLRIIYLMITILFLLMGMLHVWLIYRMRIIPKDSRHFLDFILTGFIFFMGGMFFVGLSLFITDFTLDVGHDKYTSTIIPFIIPLLAYTTYKYWQRVPKLVPEAWRYDESYLPQEPIDGPDVKWLNFIFRVEDTDYSICIPARHRVGDAFYMTVNESQLRGVPINYRNYDELGNAAALPWYFIAEDPTTKRRKYVDPLFTFEYNGIREGDIIWVRNNPL